MPTYLYYDYLNLKMEQQCEMMTAFVWEFPCHCVYGSVLWPQEELTHGLWRIDSLST